MTIAMTIATTRHYSSSIRQVPVLICACLLLIVSSSCTQARTFHPKGNINSISRLAVTTRQKNDDTDTIVLEEMDFDDFFEQDMTYEPTTTWYPTMAPNGNDDDDDDDEAEETWFSPTMAPTFLPSDMPSAIPTSEPTTAPIPEEEPAEEETESPTAAPTIQETTTMSPSFAPTFVEEPEEEEAEAPLLAPNATAVNEDERPEEIMDREEDEQVKPEEMNETPTDNTNNTTTTEGEGSIIPVEQHNNNSNNETSTNITTASSNEADMETEMPEMMTSEAPTPASTATATLESNSTNTTEAPTEEATTIDEEAGIPISSQVSLRLVGLNQEFPGDARGIFLRSAQAFISASSEGTVQDIRVQLIYQRVVVVTDSGSSNRNRNRNRKLRTLQQPQQRSLQQDQQALLVDLGVEGMRYQQIASLEDFESDFLVWLRELFRVQSLEFVDLIMETALIESEPFFETLESVEVMDPMSVVVSTPTSAPTYINPANPGDLPNSTNDNDEDDLPLVLIIGVAVGGFGLLLLVIGISRVYCWRKQKAAGDRTSSSKQQRANGNTNLALDPSTSMPSSMEESVPSAQRVARTISNNNNNNNNNHQNRANISGGSGDNSSVASSNTGLYTNNANHYNNYYGGRGSALDADSQSQLGGATTTGDMSVMDNLSYAYSLEPGIVEPSMAGMPPALPSSAASVTSLGFSAYGPGGGGDSVASTTTGMSQFTFMKQLKQTQKYNGSSNANSGKPTTEILAPPGKLGIVIDTTLDGPVVHKVNPGSALEGKLNSGDIIVAIDDVDTRAMSASSITALMVKTANQRRKLTIVRADSSS